MIPVVALIDNPDGVSVRPSSCRAWARRRGKDGRIARNATDRVKLCKLEGKEVPHLEQVEAIADAMGPPNNRLGRVLGTVGLR
jgi:hypothetical protein